MLIGYFTERPYQDPKARFFGASKEELTDLVLSNAEYDADVAHGLYNRYFDEKLYAEQIGFDGLMLNEHHSTPFTMGSVCNIEAAIRNYIALHNASPKPFVWTKTADEILASVARFCHRISGTGH